MLKLMRVVCILLVTVPVFSQSVSNYQVGTITDVKPHQSASAEASDVVTYDVSIRVGDTVYLVLYTPPIGATPPKYAAGRNILVLVGEKTVRYNNIIGESLEVPILSRKPAKDPSQSKQAPESRSNK